MGQLVAPDDAAEAIPDYRTQIPPAASLLYQVQSGTASGTGKLLWSPAADGYRLTLEISVGGRTVLAQASHGGFDAAGLAPLRFVDKRLRRPASAANFQRDAGRITFSGPPTEFILSPGAQDRLSWLLQLTAIVAAEPSLREPGARILMNLAGAHGDYGLWAFVCQGTEVGEGPAGQLVYRRAPRGPYDIAAAVWLDPARAYLPSQLSWKSGSNDAGFELRLQAPPPAP